MTGPHTSHAAAATDIVELRIHGVGGTSPAKELGVPYDELVSPTGGCVACDEELDAFWSRSFGPATQSYVWSPLTSGSTWFGLWPILLPFTLANVAGWMRPPSSHSRLARAAQWCVAVLVWTAGLMLTAVTAAWLVLLLGGLLPSWLQRGEISGWTTAATVVVALGFGAAAGLDLVTFKAFQVDRARLFRWMIVWALIALATWVFGRWPDWSEWLPLAAMVLYVAVAVQTRRRFERFDIEIGPTGATGDDDAGAPRVPGGLDDPGFFVTSKAHGWSLAAHAAVAVGVFLQSFRLRDDTLPTQGLEPLVVWTVATAWIVMTVLFLASAAAWAASQSGLSVDNGTKPSGWRYLPEFVTLAVAMMLASAVMASFDLAMRNAWFPDAGLGAELALVLPLVVALIAMVTAGIAIGVRMLVGPGPKRELAARLPRHLDLVATTGAVVMLAGVAHVLGLHPYSPAPPSPSDLMSWLSSAVVVVALGALGLIGRGMQAVGVRRQVGNVWDVLGFWPRRFHPLAVRPYSERAVPHLRKHIHDLATTTGVAITAHSQGSILAYAAVKGLPDTVANGRLALLTFGSPLGRIHARFFPAYFSREHYSDLADALETEEPDSFGSFYNCYRRTDHIGQRIFTSAASSVALGRDLCLADPPTSNPTPPDLAEVDLERDRTTESPLSGHSSYRREDAVKKWIDARRIAADGGEPPPLPGPGPDRPPATPIGNDVRRFGESVRRYIGRKHATIELADGTRFQPRPRMVGWFDPRLLAQTGLVTGLGIAFGAYTDKRDVLPLRDMADATSTLPDFAHLSECWVDYVADVGDGFGPTYSIAHALARPELDLIDGTPLQRGDLLIMGGDEVYPAPSEHRYKNQTVGPYALAAQRVEPPGDSKPPTPLVALPGNHDWYDGLTDFLRVFASGHSIGPWTTSQARSYWAVRLPHGWWVFGVDAQLNGWIDALQLRYFESQALQDGARVVVCWSTPCWVDAAESPEDPTVMEPLESFIDGVESRGAHVEAVLTGDLHHYARYESTGRQWITAGGGGAFMFPTHNERSTLEVGTASLTRKALYPEPDRSSALRRWLPLKFAAVNPSFLLLGAFVAIALAMSVWAGVDPPPPSTTDPSDTHSQADLSGRPSEAGPSDDKENPAAASTLAVTMQTAPPRSYLAGVIRSPAAIALAVLTVAGLWFFTKPARGQGALKHPWFAGSTKARLLGLGHGLVQVSSVLAVGYGSAAAWEHVKVEPTWPYLALVATTILVGGALGFGLIMGSYLTLASRLGMHDNEAYSALHVAGYKNFLRMHVSPDGGLSVYAIGMDAVPRPLRWFSPRGGPHPRRGRLVEVAEELENYQLRVIDEVHLPPTT